MRQWQRLPRAGGGKKRVSDTLSDMVWWYGGYRLMTGLGNL